MQVLATLVLSMALGGAPFGPGDHSLELEVEGRTRTAIVHVPPEYEEKTPTPLVLVLHGAATNAKITVPFTGMNEKADEAGFIAVYPNGTGRPNARLFTWNSGGFVGAQGDRKANDVTFTSALLDELESRLNVDKKRIFATGMSNGGMMCHRLAAELSDRIAAVAPVSGTLGIQEVKPSRPVPILHFHGTADTIVPYNGPKARSALFVSFESVAETIRVWREVDECPEEPKVEDLPDKADDGTTVKRMTYGPGKDGAEVVLIEITGGGHTWPGRKTVAKFLGNSTEDISANDLIWEFFEKHPLP